jgi:hypothetical protein
MSKEFLSADLKSIRNIRAMGSAGLVSLFGILDFITAEKFIGSTTVSMFLLPFLPILLLIKLTSRIRLDDNYVEKRTMTNRIQIKWKDVRSYGVYVDTRPFMPQIVDAADADEYSFLNRFFIFISTAERFDPINKDSAECIIIEYRKNVYDNVREMLDKV